MTATVERKNLQMHEKLLWDVIQRQAGTLSKALVELVQNVVDAKGKRAVVTLTEDRVAVYDDGQGFRSLKEIEEWFGTFGQPHEESEEKIYGTFRMGRGQAFAFGKNRWRTGQYEMTVDIKNEGLTYGLRQNLSTVAGCHIDIELYGKLDYFELRSCSQDLQKMLKYCPIEVVLNGEVISEDTAKTQWDIATDVAYVNLLPDENSGLEIYNLGIYVMTIPAWKLGISGIVVSRKQLKVNFARNDIQNDCEVWRDTSKQIDKLMADRLAATKSLNEAGRKRLVDKVLAGDLPRSLLVDAKVITAVTGRHYSVSEMLQRRRISHAPTNDIKGDHVHRSGKAFVVADTTLRRFDRTFDEFRDMIEDGYVSTADPYEWIPNHELVKHYTANYSVIEKRKWLKSERIWIDVLRSLMYGQGWFDLFNRREILVGESDTALAWTDSKTHITFGRGYLARKRFTPSDVGDVIATLLHECCHTQESIGSHSHDQEFYERFHDNASLIGASTLHVIAKLKRCMEKERKKVGKTVDKNAELVASLADADKQFSELREAEAANG